MVCIFCLVPLFLIPIVNILPLLFYSIMGKIYGIFGWEYRKPVRVPPACPYRPTKDVNITSKERLESEPGAQESVSKPTGEPNAKQE